MGRVRVGRPGRRSRCWLFGALVVLAAAIASAGYTRHLSQLLLDESEAIRGGTSPSVQRLVDARSELLELEGGAFALASLSPAARGERLARMRQARQLAGRSIGAAFALGPFSGEPPLRAELTSDLNALDAVLRNPSGSPGRLLASIEALDGALGRLIHFDMDRASEQVALIERTWRRSESVQLGLAALAVLLAALAARGALLALRRYTRRLEVRSSELELFAGRVAHDVRSPLSAVSLAVELLSPAATDPNEKQDPQRRLAERALASLGRVHAIVEGLLDFARSGAEPSRRGRAEVSEVVSGVLAELATPAEEAGIVLQAAPLSPCQVVCAPGVLASLISNLARNAIEHMDDRSCARAERRVTVQVQPGRERVRVEVDDTGPGVPRGWEELIFQPYLRGPDSRRTGVGLGLATVKRLVEAHAGTVGIAPSPSGGARFWFELPRAPEAKPPARVRRETPVELRIG